MVLREERSSLLLHECTGRGSSVGVQKSNEFGRLSHLEFLLV